MMFCREAAIRKRTSKKTDLKIKAHSAERKTNGNQRQNNSNAHSDSRPVRRTGCGGTTDRSCGTTYKTCDELMQENSNLSADELAAVDAFAKQIDITNSAQIMCYGADGQKKMADFSEGALENVRTKDPGQTGDMITDLIGELRGFECSCGRKGLLGLFPAKNPPKFPHSKQNTTRPKSMLNALPASLKSTGDNPA